MQESFGKVHMSEMPYDYSDRKLFGNAAVYKESRRWAALYHKCSLSCESFADYTGSISRTQAQY
jgi:hypothetical protein